MRVNPTIKSGKGALSDKTKELARRVAIAVVFIIAYFFFFKLVFF